MGKDSTGALHGLRILYKSYGGLSALLCSSYFWASILISLYCWRDVEGAEWIEASKTILPVLAGFSIAAFAIIFAVLDGNAREALRKPSKKLGDRSPFLVLTSSLCHATLVQLVGVLAGIIVSAKNPFRPMISDDLYRRLCRYFHLIHTYFSSFGLVVTIYGIVLVVAAILSIFRVLEIQSHIPAKPGNKVDNGRPGPSRLL